MSSPVLTVCNVLEPNIRKRRMLFPIMSMMQLVSVADEAGFNFTWLA